MKKKLFWALTLVLFALFPYQNVKADLIQLSRNGWTATASSEHANDASEGMASYAIDGNLGTWWHNEYDGANADRDVPHWIMFNLGSIQSFDAFNYVSRTADPNGCNGNINNYTLYVSDTAPNTSDISGTMTEVKSGSFNYNAQEHKVDLGTTVSGQYVLLYASTTLGTAGANLHANCAEFYLYEKGYCTYTGNMANTGNGAGRKLNSFTLSDGTNQLEVTNIQTSASDAVYKDKTTLVLTTNQGATLSFSAMDWNGSWMHAYVYIDYDRDKTFETIANNDGTTDGELVSYNYYNGKNINNASMTDGCGVSAANIPSWTLPTDLAPGEYRLRFKIDWNSIDPCGSSTIKNDNGAIVDITLNVESGAPSNEKKQNLFSSANISQANNIYPYRIPGIAKAYNNDLIAVAAHLICGTDPGYGQVDVVCRVSKDNGVTWGDEVDVAVGDASLINANTNVFEIAFGDPAIVADRESNKVAIFVVAGCTHYVSATRQNPNMIGVIYGTYNQNTEEWDWEEPKNITEDIYSLFDSGSQIQSAFIAGGKVFQSRIVKNGDYYRLYAAINARPGGNRVVYSDDFGRTWHALGGAFAQPVPSGDEPKCEEMPDGRVIISSRKSAGRYYNIYTYTNTATGEGSWGSVSESSFNGAGRTPGGSAANGEILIVPVKRNSDSKDMYLALQSLPTGSGRTDVCIYYKELTSFDDMSTPANLSAGWNGYYHVTTLESAYSSMDLQADGKVGFIYEEDLTSGGTVQNPVTTTFPNGLDPWGSSTHNFDGYNNIYRAYTIEELTNNAYTLKTEVSRGAFVKTYLTAAVDASLLSADSKTALKASITSMGDNPTTTEVDAIYAELNKDPWDGKIVTFTNIQQSGTTYTLYVNGSGELATSSSTAASLGTSAQFLCEKRADGIYSFKNLASNNYMIYRHKPGETTAPGANDNKGVISEYNATYCNWTLGDGSGTVAGTYYMYAERPKGDISYQILLSTGVFDGWVVATPGVQYASGYSNLYEIGIVSVPTEELLSDAKTLISKAGVGYPAENSDARTALQSAINAAEADPNSENGMALQNAIDDYYASTDVEMPAEGSLYSFIVGHGNSKYYIYNNNGTLAIASYTEGTTVLPATAKFLCEVSGNYYMFRTSDGKYMAFPPYGTENYSDASPDGIEDVASDKTKFSIAKLYNNINANVTVSNQDLFGKIYLTVLLRGHKNDGGAAESGIFVVKTTEGIWDGALTPYDNGTFSSAISVIPQEIDERTIAVAVSSSDTEKGEVAIEGTDEKTITTSEIVTVKAIANDGYKFVKWTVDDVEVGTDATYKDATSGDKTYTAHFEPLSATDKYAEYICTPGINAAGNTTFVRAATISEGVNIDDATIEIGDLAVKGQKGVTATITAKAGATFNLNLTYTLNWGDLTIFGMTQENSEMLYGPFEGSWVSGGSTSAVLTPITEAGLTVNETTVTYPIAIPSTLNVGDIYVVRALTGGNPSTACDTGITEGGYIDFLFEIVGEAVPHTVKVVVTPSGGGSATINGEERTQIEASGIVSLSATPKEGYRFLSWTDNNEKLISENADFTKPIVADTTYRANFVKVWNVTATSNNLELGTVTIDGKNSEGSVDHATTITLTAKPTTGGKFIHWTLNDEPISTQNPFKTTILKDEVYQAVFEKDYPTVKLKYTGNETQINRYLKSMTAVAGELTTIAFDADSETSLPRVDAEYTAFGNGGSSTATPTTTGALIDKTANPIKVIQGTETIALTFKQWETDMENGIVAASDAQLLYTQQAIFVDWNGDKDFADANEAYDKSSDAETNGTFAAPEGYTRSITIPNNIETGVYRMRVVYHEPVGAYTSDWRGDFTEATSANIVINGKVYDFAIEIVADENYITFTAPGGTYFKMGETADVTLSYPVVGTKIYYTTNGFDPDENSAVIDNGGKVALNTFNEGVVTIKARAYDPEDGSFCSSVYSAAYNISSHYSLGEVPITTYNANTTTIVGAAISNGVGVENGTINHNFVQGQRTATTLISVAGDATFNLDVTFNLKWYGFKIYRINYTGEEIQRSIVSNYLGSNANEVNANEFESDLTTAGYKFTKDGDQYTVSIPITIKNGENELGEGTNVAYRFIVTGGLNAETLAPSGSYGDGEYVDFMFTVQPQSSITKLAGTATKDLNITVKTTDACYLQVGGYSQNLPEAQTLTIPASLNAAGEMDIQVVGAEIEKMDIEVLEIGTNVQLPDVDYLGEVTLKSDADYVATTVSYASVLPEDGIKVVVEKEITLPYDKYDSGIKNAYYNFLSMPFDFDPGINIEYWDGDSWQPAALEQDIRILRYNSLQRAYGTQYYGKNWQTIGGTGGVIHANNGFVMVGNVKHDKGDHKMKVRFKSFYAEQAKPGQTAVTREIKYAQDGSHKSVKAERYRNDRGETHRFDADWQHVGSPYLTHSDGIDYILYYHDGYKYKAVSQIENPSILAFQSVMFQANLGDFVEKNIVITPLASSSRTKMAQSVYGRAYLAINDEESVKIMLSDEASENFVVNEDAWYLEPTSNNEATMSVNVAGSEASITVQPEPSEMPLTVYTGVKSTQTISLSRVDGDVNIYLKDAVTDEVVCLNDEDYTFEASPKTTIANRFTISMTEPTGIEGSIVSTSDIKVAVNGDNLTIYGTEAGEAVTLYSMNGTVLATAETEDGVTTIETTATGVIVVKVGTEAVKVVK